MKSIGDLVGDGVPDSDADLPNKKFVQEKWQSYIDPLVSYIRHIRIVKAYRFNLLVQLAFEARLKSSLSMRLD